MKIIKRINIERKTVLVNGILYASVENPTVTEEQDSMLGEFADLFPL